MVFDKIEATDANTNECYAGGGALTPLLLLCSVRQYIQKLLLLNYA